MWMFKDMNKYSWFMILTFIPTIVGLYMRDNNMIEGFSLLDRFFAASMLLSMLSLILSMLHVDAFGDINRTYPWMSGFIMALGVFAFVTNFESLLLSLPTKNLTTLAFTCMITGLIGACTSGLFFSHLVISYKSFREVLVPENVDVK